MAPFAVPQRQGFVELHGYDTDAGAEITMAIFPPFAFSQATDAMKRVWRKARAQVKTDDGQWIGVSEDYGMIKAALNRLNIHPDAVYTPVSLR
jgi:hypothetical protein